jgi:hypothetical protein
MARSDPTKDPEFQRVLGNLLKAPPKQQADMKVGRNRSESVTRKGGARGDGPRRRPATKKD